jgi:hypothetical protein
MPSAEDDREPWSVILDGGGDLDSAANHWSGKDGDANAKSIDTFAFDSCQVVRFNRSVDHHDVEVSLAQRGGERK